MLKISRTLEIFPVTQVGNRCYKVYKLYKEEAGMKKPEKTYAKPLTCFEQAIAQICSEGANNTPKPER